MDATGWNYCNVAGWTVLARGLKAARYDELEAAEFTGALGYDAVTDIFLQDREVVLAGILGRVVFAPKVVGFRELVRLATGFADRFADLFGWPFCTMYSADVNRCIALQEVAS